MDMPAWTVQMHANDLAHPYRFTVQGVGGEQAELLLTVQQMKLLNARFSRSYLKRCRAERIIDAIENASNYRQLEEIARSYSLCDACDFADINIYGLKRVLKVVVNVLYRYPKLRSKMCYLGSPRGYNAAMERMMRGDTSVLHDFALQYICEESVARRLGVLMRNLIGSMLSHSESYIAMAIFAFGMFDAVLLDENDYEGYAYIQLVSSLRRDAASGFHPQGCWSPESVVYHELGHLIDYLCCLSEKFSLVDYVRTLSAYDVRAGLSQYATTSTQELIAEAFAEYMCNDSPRPIAQRIGQIMDAEYARLL